MEFPLLHLNLIRKPAGTAVRKVKYEIFGRYGYKRKAELDGKEIYR